MNRDQLLARIAIDPNVCFGKPCVRGHRIWVSLILDSLSSGMKTEDILREYPGLEENDVLACIAYGAEMMRPSHVPKPSPFHTERGPVRRNTQMTSATEKLAIDGGRPVAPEPVPGGWHGPAEIGDEEIEAVTAVLRSKALFRFLDPERSRCAELEGKFRAMTGCEYALAVGGGTAALVSGLAGIGVGEGDEVIIPGYTYIASAAAVLICGAVPVIAEIDESLTIDAADAESKITGRTRAIMPVHMRGIPCDMDAVMALANRHKLDVIEDTAQACGGFYRGKALGSFGRVGCFSLQQYKIMTAGEGGMVVTNDREVFDRAAIRHDSAMCFWKPDESSVRPFPGANFRMNEMEGALGCVQFDRMAGILERTRAIKKRIVEELEGVPVVRLHESPCAEGDCGIHVSFFLDSADEAKYFAQALRAENVPCGSLYDKGIPDRHVYCYWEYVMEKASAHRTGWPWTSPFHDQSRRYSADMCPRTLDVLGRNVVVGIHQNLTDEHVGQIIAGVWKVANAMAARG